MCNELEDSHFPKVQGAISIVVPVMSHTFSAKHARMNYECRELERDAGYLTTLCTLPGLFSIKAKHEYEPKTNEKSEGI
jgi:hypothetical protein